MKRYEIALWGMFPISYSLLKGAVYLSKKAVSHYNLKGEVL